MTLIDELAAKIVTLDSEEQESLWERVIQLNSQKGLETLSKKYRERLAIEGKLDKTADAIMSELKKLREDIAASDYQP